MAQTLAQTLLQAAPQQLAHRLRGRRRQLVQVGLPLEDACDRVGHGLAREHRLAGEHLEQDAAEGPHVGAPVHRLAPRLLGAHVSRGADDHPGQRAGGSHRGQAGRLGARGLDRTDHRLRQAEVQNLDRVVGQELDVGGLEVAVHHALVVRRLQRRGDLGGNGQRVVQVQRAPAGDPRFQRLALQKLHRQEVHVFQLVQPVDRRDVRVVERGQQPRLALEPRQPLGVGAEGVGQDLDRDLAVERRIHGLPDHAHGSAADLFDQTVVQQLLSGLDGHFAVPPCRTESRV